MSIHEPLDDIDLLAKPLPHRPITEDEFLAWCGDGAGAEWLDGKVVVMSPASLVHASLAAFLLRVVSAYADEHKLGKVLGIEFQVRMGNPPRRQVPDLLFVARDRLGIIKATHVEGSPDLLVEIVSPESVDRDWRDKFLEYQAAGVLEYWVVDPLYQRLEMYALTRGEYVAVESENGITRSQVLPGFYLRGDWLWQADLPAVRDVLRELQVTA